MKQKQIYLQRASFAALFFVLLGYVVKFYPSQLSELDTSIQTAIRGQLPELATRFWTSVTVLGNALPLFAFAIALSLVFYLKSWKAEAALLLGSLVLLGVVSTALKYLYQRPRPSIEWLIQTVGYSFPSWHAASTLLVAGVLTIILQQRLNRALRARALQVLLIALALIIGVSRIYVGVHYPTDILGGWLLALCILEVAYPFYDQLRFTWRFQSKQK